MTRGVCLRLVVVLGALAVPGCSDQRAPPDSTEPAPAVVEREKPLNPIEVRDWDPAAGTASITGTVIVRGQAPLRRRIDLAADEECKALHAEAPLDESAVVSSSGRVRNAFVFVKRGLEGWRFPVPSEPVTLEQKACVFVPRVLGVQVRQDVLIRNRDPLLHNVHSYSRRNFGFNFGQTADKEDRKSFRKPEVMVTLKCDVHPWMRAHIGVLPHPVFAVSGDDGSFALEDLPPGDYTIEAWHEVFGTVTLNVSLGDKETKTLEFGFKGA